MVNSMEKEKTAGQKLEEQLCYKSEACLRSQPELAAVLMQLSLAGYLRELPGQQYSLL